MSDSEDDLLSNNASSYHSVRTTVCVKGPNNTNVSEFSFPNHFLSSTRNMQPFNIKQSKYGPMKCDQQSLYYRRGLSPMSVSKMQDLGSHNFYHHYPGHNHRSYQRSVYNGRGGSPTSVRSIDSTASMSATEIALAFKNANYNKYELRLIKEAYNKYLKSRSRRRVEKRRNLKLFLRNSRRKCGEDSGDLGSDSSMSSDDCRSTRTATYKKNLVKYKVKNDNVMNQRTTINESDLYKDCTDNLRKNFLRNMLNVDPIPSSTIVTTERATLLKDRFEKGCSLPAQRFNKCLPSSNEPKSNGSKERQTINHDKQIMNNLSCELESEEEEIFSEITTTERNIINSKPSNKRYNALEKLQTNPSKKFKSPKTLLQNGLDHQTDCDKNDKINFVFAKPQLPIGKPNKVKGKVTNPEILISNSRQPLADAENFANSILSPKKSQSSRMLLKQTECKDKLVKEIDHNEFVKENQTNDDVSMRPSFIKRKLFTQNLDIAENRNLNNSSPNNSPQIKKLANNKEKNKTRKLASSQSCLSRDVLFEGNQIMDLIQKIVPSDQTIVNKAANQYETSNRNSQPNANDKWDITSVISTCNTNEFSDTYTDEEIFNPATKNVNKSKNNCNIVQSKLNTNCSIVIEKLPQDVTSTKKSNNFTKEQIVKNTIRKVDTKTKPNLPRKSFWDTDLESDFENNESLPRNLNLKKINGIADKNEEEGAKYINNNINGKKTEKVELNMVTNQNKPKRTVTMKNTTQTNLKESNSKTSEKRQTTEGKKKNPQGPEKNISNMSIRGLRSNSRTRKLEKEEKPYKTFGTVSLINHRVLRSKRLEKKNGHNNTTPCEGKQMDVSNELNISIKSLRSWHSKH